MERDAVWQFFSAAAGNSGSRLPIYVLELGIGVGLFARFFLDRFQEICRERGRDYYDRLVYVAGDKSERMLADAGRHGVFAHHRGHYKLAVMDALNPVFPSSLTPNPYSLSPVKFRAVFLNYLLDCLPAADLKILDGEVHQLHVRTCLARNIP